MKQELYYYVQQGIRSKITCAIASAASFVLLLSVPTVKDDLSKLLILGGAFASAGAAVVSGRTIEETESALNDYAASTGMNRQRKLLWTPSLILPTQEPTKPTTAFESSPVLFDLRDIGEDRNAFPNVFIVGAPGTGKTTLAEYLGVVLKAGKRYAMHPHAKPSDFRGFDRVFGGGRNIGTPEDEPMSWAEVIRLGSNPTVAQVIMAVHQLMQDRYLLYYQGREDFEDVDLYIDEVPAIATQLGKKFMAQYIPALIMECRKVGIRLWFLTQAFTLSKLGLEGGSDLKEGATVIRLGKLAVNEANTLARQKRLEESSLLSLKQESRPALVDDIPARIPGYSEMKGAIEAFVTPSKKPSRKRLTKEK